ncbi:Peptidoglycan/LPS O-acetylase OafA/YrhL, contains acyltransferase and SGNH-hydrolase domains [Sulfitobacter marinus]|uniref:Peptidoglycan/LPS O-acetylase OafA/YrhL, contains acyltransferase and SGNH-hydrolase domains n=1 Tax=Sulfitobacter marinus TaxID=394264 RepID=A0A1I6VBQ6_9RHOB|nr:acyltransferase [Sulfitobacter marinus]SFT11168.1 Peptidoglycan/LPS O-acetylase OafA/YrhL, contains acyltransferase and SGNH-hydrolase domains [Sulfitobacter marinus]
MSRAARDTLVTSIMRRAGTPLRDVAQGRDNNFNLVRFCAATAVLVSHAWPVALGPEQIEPLKSALGHSLGQLAVYVFFALSGFFITASFERSMSPAVFITLRAARLFPGLAVSLVFVACVIGPLVTILPAKDYWTDAETGMFFFRNMGLVWPQYTLPGVFTGNPYPTVEGSIWTLSHEAACYFFVLILGVTGILARGGVLFCVLILYAAFYAAPVEFHHRIVQLQWLSLPFVVGIAFWKWRGWLRLSLPVLAGLCVFAYLGRTTPFAYPLMILALSYGAFWLGYAPSGRVRLFNRLGDYSYGIYIYAFPLQGLAVWLWGAGSPMANILLSFPMALICAVASWHWVEKPALENARAGAVKWPRFKRLW